MHSEFSMNTLFNNTQKNVQLFVNLWTIGHQALLSMDSIGKNTRVGCHTLLQGIFPTQGWNPCLFLISRWGFFVLFCFVFVFFLALVSPGKPKCTHCLSVLIFCYYDYLHQCISALSLVKSVSYYI